jgi:sulfonate transport system permease protein
LAKSASAPSRVAAASRSGSAAAPRRWWRIVGGAILPLLILMFWQIVSMSGLLPAYRLPSPTSVWLAAEDLSQRGLLGQDIVISLQRVWLGFLLGAVLGLIAAAVVGLTRLGDVLLSPTLGALRAVPSLAWLPLLVLYIGINENEKVYLIAIGAFFPVYTTVASALRYVDPQLVELGRAYGLRGTALLGRVQLPAVIPSVVSSLRLALAQSWLFLVAAELLGSSMGLGFLLLDSQNSSRLDRLFLTIILLGIFGKLTDVLIGVLERFLLRRWGR